VVSTLIEHKTLSTVSSVSGVPSNNGKHVTSLLKVEVVLFKIAIAYARTLHHYIFMMPVVINLLNIYNF
jgi:hypothetical protein